jgi:hypothetical protein
MHVIEILLAGDFGTIDAEYADQPVHLECLLDRAGLHLSRRTGAAGGGQESKNDGHDPTDPHHRISSVAAIGIC